MVHDERDSQSRTLATGDGPFPAEPPAQVRSELLWRLAVLLYREHGVVLGKDRCVCCHQPWPCSGRRLAELALHQAAGRA